MTSRQQEHAQAFAKLRQLRERLRRIGSAVVDATVYKAANPSWAMAWYIFAAYAFVVGLLFMILFKDPQKKAKADAK